MLGLMGFSGSLPLYVIHRYYIFVFTDRANNLRCLLACLDVSPPGRFAPLDVSIPGRDLPGRFATGRQRITVPQYYSIANYKLSERCKTSRWQTGK